MPRSVSADNSEQGSSESSSSDRQADVDDVQSDELHEADRGLPEVSRQGHCRLGKRTYGLSMTDIGEICQLRRRRKLDRHLQALQAVLPYSPSVRRSSIMVDALRYIEELRRRVSDISAEIEIEQQALMQQEIKELFPVNDMKYQDNISFQPLVEVFSQATGLRIHIKCEKLPGLLVAVLEALEKLGLIVMHASVACQSQFIFNALGVEDRRAGLQLEIEEVKAAISNTLLRERSRNKVE